MKKYGNYREIIHLEGHQLLITIRMNEKKIIHSEKFPDNLFHQKFFLSVFI